MSDYYPDGVTQKMIDDLWESEEQMELREKMEDAIAEFERKEAIANNAPEGEEDGPQADLAEAREAMNEAIDEYEDFMMLPG